MVLAWSPLVQSRTEFDISEILTQWHVCDSSPLDDVVIVPLHYKEPLWICPISTANFFMALGPPSNTRFPPPREADELLEADFGGAFLCDVMVQWIEAYYPFFSPRVLQAVKSIDPTFFIANFTGKVLHYIKFNPPSLSTFYDPMNRKVYDMTPLLLTVCMHHLNLQPGQRFGHVGYGTGYALTVAAMLVGPTGCCLGDNIQTNLSTGATGRIEQAKMVSFGFAFLHFLNYFPLVLKK